MGFTDPESTHKGKINFSEILAPINKGASTPPWRPTALPHSPLFLTHSVTLPSASPGVRGDSTLGIYGRAALMSGFLKRFTPMMGAFLSFPVPFGNLTLTEGQKWTFCYRKSPLFHTDV